MKNIKLEPSNNRCDLESPINSLSLEPSINKVEIQLIATVDETFFISQYQIIDEAREV
jgi:hypothetical protein